MPALLTLLVAIGSLLITFYLLAIICDEFFVQALDLIAEKLKMPADVAGATFMAMGSSAPELFTSLIAAITAAGLFGLGGGAGAGAHADVGSGTIVGSAIFNILVIIGASAAFKRAKLQWQPVVRDILFYCLSIILLLFAFQDGRILFAEAAVFVGVYGLYLLVLSQWRKIMLALGGKRKSKRAQEKDDPIEVLDESENKQSPSPLARFAKQLLGIVIPDCEKNEKKVWFTFASSVALIGVLSYVMVESALVVAEVLHIPAAIVALTVLAAGTSIPDLLSSLAVAKTGRGDMAISNAVGSNIFDILIGLGLPWTVVLGWQQFQGNMTGTTMAITVSTENLLSSVFLLFATVVAVFVVIAMRQWSIGPRAGWLLIALYLAYLGFNIGQVMGVL